MATPVMTGGCRTPRTGEILVDRPQVTPTPNAPTTAEFLNIAMMTLPSGGTVLRRACGITTWLSDSLKVRPIARAASAWPAGTELTPERTASHTKALV